MGAGDASSLPGELESRILTVLDLPLDRQDRAIEELIGAHPHLVKQIRDWVALARRDDDSQQRPPVALDPLPTVPGYRLLERLGAGGMGEVFLAEQEQLVRRVALKRMRSDLLAVPGARQRFAREARLLSQLDHVGICHLYEVGEHEGRPFLAMQWIRGTTLAEVIRRDRDQVAGPPSSRTGRQRIEAAIALVEKVARALHTAHEAGLVHRDVKPANIMVRDDREPVLLDFGLARDLQDEGLGTASHELLGTPRYMAPEQIEPRGREIDRRVDVYALGVTLYELLTLQPPFVGQVRSELFAAIVRGVFVRPRRLQRAMPRELEIVIECAMDRDPNRRYPSAAALADDLRRVRNREPILARKAGVPLRLRRWLQRHPTRSVAVVLVALLTAVSYAWAEDLRAAEASTRATIAATALREGLAAARSGAHAAALRYYEEAEGSGCEDEVGLSLARIEAYEGSFQMERHRAELATLAKRAEFGSHAARATLLLGQERMASDVVAGRAMIIKAVALHESGAAPLTPADLHLAQAWLTDDLDQIIEQLQTGLRDQPGHLASLGLLIPAMLWHGQATAALALLDAEQARLPRPAVLLPRLLAMAALDRTEECDGLLGELGATLGSEVAASVKPLIELLLLLQEHMGATCERLVGDLAQGGKGDAGAPSRIIRFAKLVTTLRSSAGALPELLDGRYWARAHPSLLKAYSHLPKNLPLILKSPVATLTKGMKATVDAFPDSLCAALYASSYIGNSEADAADKFAEGLRLLALADQARGLTGAMPSVRRYRTYLRVGCLSTWIGGLPAGTPERLEKEQMLAAAIDAVLAVPGVTETEYRAYEIIAWSRTTLRRTELVERLLVAWHAAFGSTKRLDLARADYLSQLVAASAAEATSLLQQVLERDPDCAEAKALLQRIK